jgi:hypothetical protein
MLGFIARLTMARFPRGTESDLLCQADDAGGTEEGTRVPIFIHPKALTFPIVVALVKGAWLAAATLPFQWAASRWFPFSACLILGLLVTISNLSEQKVRVLDWIFGLAIGILNSLVIFGAVVGIPMGKA